MVDIEKISQRVLKFWEVYIDEGNLGKYLQAKYPDVKCDSFHFPNGTSRCTKLRETSASWSLKRSHTIVMVAPECRLWSPMQNMNYRTPERRALLADMRNLEESTHFAVLLRHHSDAKKIYYDCTLEQPADAVSWRTETLEKDAGLLQRLCWIGAALDSSWMQMIHTMSQTNTFQIYIPKSLPSCELEMPMHPWPYTNDGTWPGTQAHAELRA